MPKVFERIDRARPFYDVTYKIIMTLCKILLVLDILITSMAVAGRYISFIPDPAWSEEVVLTLMTYMAVLSAALAIRDMSHIRMTALDKYLPRGLIKALDLLADVAVFALGVIMLTQGWKLAVNLGRFGKYDSMPWLSRFWMYFPIPLAGGAMMVFELERIYTHIKAFFIKNDGKEAQQA